MKRIRQRLQFWMLLPMLPLVVALELTTGLPGIWTFVVYGLGLTFLALVMITIIDREGRPIRNRSEFRHGNDMHGHY